MFNNPAVLDLELGKKDLDGTPALEAEKRLVLGLIAQWRRRKQHLLQVGCGSGFFLQIFLDAGLQTTGTDRSREMLQKTRSRLGASVDLHLAQPEHLPFEDKEFDYVALINVLEFSPDPDQALLEACRVGKKKLLLLFLNRFSLLYLTRNLRLPFGASRQRALQEAQWRSWGEVKKLVRKNLGPRPMRGASVLHGPKCVWGRKNNYLTSLPFGALCAAELDISREKLSTPLLAWNAVPKAS